MIKKRKMFEGSAFEFEYFEVEDVKLAVQGLLKDLKELESRWKEKLRRYPQGVQQLYSLQLFAEFENLIKKRFGDFDED